MSVLNKSKEEAEDLRKFLMNKRDELCEREEKYKHRTVTDFEKLNSLLVNMGIVHIDECSKIWSLEGKELKETKVDKLTINHGKGNYGLCCEFIFENGNFVSHSIY